MVTFRVKERATGKPIKQPQDVYESIKDLAMADQESFWALGFNDEKKEIFRRCLFIGAINKSCVDPAIIFNRLLAARVSYWIAVHNHPSGSLYPSAGDNTVTRALRSGSEILGLGMIDHLIVGDGGYYSFADNLWETLDKTGDVGSMLCFLKTDSLEDFSEKRRFDDMDRKMDNIEQGIHILWEIEEIVEKGENPVSIVKQIKTALESYRKGLKPPKKMSTRGKRKPPGNSRRLQLQGRGD